MQKINVLVTMPFAQPLIDRLADVSPTLVVTRHEAHSAEDILDVAGEVDVLYAWQALPFPAQAPRLRWVQLHTAGADTILEHPLYTQSEVIFTTTSGIHAIQLAEYVMAQVLAFAHHLPEMMEDKATTTWVKGRWNRYLPAELYGATLGIVGYGSVGRQVARLAQAFGMKVLAIKRNARQLADGRYSIPGVGDPDGELPDRIYPPQALHSFLHECDYVVLTVPLNAQTRHLMDAAALEAMKPEAILVNVARGDVVDDQALISALQEEKIRGAALDVFAEEPLPPDNPLWMLPNVIISPHVSGFSPHYDERATDLFAENLRRFVADEPLLNVVDRAKDY